MHRFRRSRLPLLVAALAVLVAFPAFAGEAHAATSKWTARCDDVNIRTAPRTSSTAVREVKEGAVLTVVGSVRGGVWTAKCGKSMKSRTWLKIVAINGRSTKSLFHRNAVYAAAGLFKANSTPTPPPTPKPVVVPATSRHLSNCSVRLRTSASTNASAASVINNNVVVTSATKVSGGSWKADCKSNVSGSSWYKITAVNGKSVSSLFGVKAVYAATGLFRPVSSTPGSGSGYHLGIDVSNWQGTINWAKVAASGKKFVIAKATEGISHEDRSYDRNKAGARAQGLRFGAYHFAQPANNPIREADWFIGRAGYERGMLIPTLDLERTGGRSKAGLTSWVKAWLGRVKDRLGVKAMIYASPGFWREHLSDTRWFADNGYAILWVAHWNTNNPSVPAANWGGRSWTFWQYSARGSVPGISGNVDLNRFRYASFDSVTY